MTPSVCLTVGKKNVLNEVFVKLTQKLKIICNLTLAS